jgi:hypothetical protein
VNRKRRQGAISLIYRGFRVQNEPTLLETVLAAALQLVDGACNLLMARRKARPAARALSFSPAICFASLATTRAAPAAFALALGLEATFCAA